MSPLGLGSRKKKDGEEAAAKPAKEKPAKAPKAPKAPKAAKQAAPPGASTSGGIVVEKAKSNIYTVMLILSFVALVIGCACLYAEFSQYGSIKPNI